MNMFKPVKAKSVEQYIKKLSPERKQAIIFLHELIKKTVPKMTPHFAYNMLGYGSFKYTNYKKEQIDWPVIALASQKNYISLYFCAVKDGEYLAEKHQEELGKVNVGKSCVRFKKIEDLNIPAIKKLLKLASKHAGFGQTSD